MEQIIERDYYLNKENPDSNGRIAACLFSIRSVDMFATKIIKTIKIRRKDCISFDLIFEHSAINGYFSENNQFKVKMEEEKPQFIKVSKDDIQSILSFVTDKKALQMLKEYLTIVGYKDMTKLYEISNENSSSDDECLGFQDKEYDIKVESDSSNFISGFFTKQIKYNDKYEKTMAIKVSGKWQPIYYGQISSENLIIEQMFRQTDELEIECIKSIVKDNNIANSDLNFYVNQQNPIFDKNKQY